MAARGEAHQLQRSINETSEKAEDLTQYLTRLARAIADAESQLYVGYTKLVRDLAVDVVDTLWPGGENREKRVARGRGERRSEEQHEVTQVTHSVSDTLDLLTDLGHSVNRAINASVDVEKRSLEHFERGVERKPARKAPASKSASTGTKASLTSARGKSRKKRSAAPPRGAAAAKRTTATATRSRTGRRTKTARRPRAARPSPAASAAAS